ncbi:MAG: AbrB/MazE/SpoVT family DNA-binding domain-containing protein [Bifidobacteriaceae bacterium]|nr:AbrB/MazE/SpoVT family DNA-binding domain-containing protein [Bifidobacteriaceae bacterium]
MTSKGRIVVPKQVRESSGLAPGSRVVFAKAAAAASCENRRRPPASAGRTRNVS